MNSWWTDQTTTDKTPSRIEKVSLEDLVAMLLHRPPRRYITEIVEHHSAIPAVRHYKMRASWVGIQRNHRAPKWQRGRGWSDIGYHIGVGPDGTIWLLRPVGRGGGHTLGHNADSIGLCMLGDYRIGKDDPTVAVAMAVNVTAALCTAYNLGPEAVFFHSDFARKDCPGSGIIRSEFRGAVDVTMRGNIPVPPEADTQTIPVYNLDGHERIGQVILPPGGWTLAQKEGRPRAGDHLADERPSLWLSQVE